MRATPALARCGGEGGGAGAGRGDQEEDGDAGGEGEAHEDGVEEKLPKAIRPSGRGDGVEEKLPATRGEETGVKLPERRLTGVRRRW